MIFVLTFLNFAFGTHSNGICLDSRHLVLGLRVQSTSVGSHCLGREDGGDDATEAGGGNLPRETGTH